MNKKAISPLTAGLITGGILVVIGLVINLAGLTANRSAGWIQYLIILGAPIYFITQYGKANDYNKTFGELFGYGFKTTVIFTLIVLAFIGVLLAISPEMKQQALDTARQEMEKQNRPDGEVDKAMDMVSRYFYVAAIGGALFATLLFGTIGSLIGAGVTKKDPRPGFDQFPS